MNIKQFLSGLQGVRSKFVWYKDGERIRAVMKKRGDDETTKGYSTFSSGRICVYCPITALLRFRKKTKYPVFFVHTSGEALGIGRKTVTILMNASDKQDCLDRKAAEVRDELLEMLEPGDEEPKCLVLERKKAEVEKRREKETDVISIGGYWEKARKAKERGATVFLPDDVDDIIKGEKVKTNGKEPAARTTKIEVEDLLDNARKKVAKISKKREKHG